MKKTLLISAFATFLVSPISGESFSGVFSSGKGSVLLFNKGTLPDLSKDALNADVTKDYGGFGLNGGFGGVELGYSFRFANNFVLGASVGGGYKHNVIKEARDTAATSGNTDGKNYLGLDFVNSGLAAEARLRLGMAFGRFHVYLNPGMELAMTNPELTVHYKGEEDKDSSHKVTYLTDKEPEWKERLSFVVGLNVEYAVSQTVFIGGNVGFRYGFADVKNISANFSETSKSEAVAKVVKDVAYKNPIGVELGVIVGASF